MLTLWLDYGARVSELEKEYARRERKQILNFSMPTIRSDIEKLNKVTESVKFSLRTFLFNEDLGATMDEFLLAQCMNECSKSLASYQFLTAFPQLISRICMTHSGTFAVMSVSLWHYLRRECQFAQEKRRIHTPFSALQGIIVRVLRDFPQQAMWQMMAVSKSTMSMRADRCRAIFLNAPV